MWILTVENARVLVLLQAAQLVGRLGLWALVTSGPLDLRAFYHGQREILLLMTRLPLLVALVWRHRLLLKELLSGRRLKRKRRYLRRVCGIGGTLEA